eukprot:6461424-Amphidinium_carterae.1
MRFCYFAEGREVGAMTVHDIWFGRRLVDMGKPDKKKKKKNANVMITTFTAKKQDDPYNGAGVAEQPTDVTI